MDDETTLERHVRFGPFEVDLRNRELRRQGVRLRLQRQPFAVLEALLEAPGDLVTREALGQRLWPEGTFVEFDKGLNTAVMKLREALGEDPQSPHFIETVAREGYRFVAAVEPVAVLDAPDSAGEPAGDARSRASPPAPSATAEPRADRRRWTAPGRLVAVLALVLGTIAVAALLLRPGSAPAAGDSLRFALREPPGAVFSTSGSFMALSPDGRSIAFVASSKEGVDRLWLQPLDSLTAKELEGTEHAAQPFWSPDSAALAFFAEGRLKRLDLARGSPRTLDTVSPSGLAGSWSDGGTLLYSRARASASADHRQLVRTPAAGGPGSPLPVPEGVDPGAYLLWPRFFPDGRTYLFLAQVGDRERNGLYVASLDRGPAHRISPATSSAEYAGGRLFYVDRGILLAQPFDAARRRLTGAAVPLADGVVVNPRTGRAAFSVSAANGGIVAYRQPARSRLEWFDRGGSSLGIVGSPAVYHDFSVAPDGQRVAAAILDAQTGTHDIWILEPGGAKTRFTWSAASEVSARWSADGSRIAYASDASGRWQVLVKPVSGGEEEMVAESAGIVAPSGWNGSVLLIGRFNPRVEVSLHPGDDVRLAADASLGILDSVSPDGRWIAHSRDDTTSRVATKALYVDAVGPAQGSWHVAARGSLPRWRADAGELYYLADDHRLMAVRIGREASFEIGPPEALFTTAAVEPSGLEGTPYEVAPDGQRFLVKVAAESSAILVLANWKSLLEEERRSSPAGRG